MAVITGTSANFGGEVGPLDARKLFHLPPFIAVIGGRFLASEVALFQVALF